MTFIAPPHTPFLWQDTPSIATPVNAADLIAAEQDLVSYTQQAITAHDNYLNAAILHPSGNPTGVTDDANFAAAVASLPNGGTIYLVGDATTPFYTATGWVPPAQTLAGGLGGGPVCLQGLGAPLIAIGSAAAGAVTAISYHRTSNYNQTSPTILQPGVLRDITIDGTNAGSTASVGLSIGDGMGYSVQNLLIKNFTGTGAKGVLFTNSNLGGGVHFFCEKSRFQVFAINCTDCFTITAGSGSSSWEYCMFDFMVITSVDQRAVVVTNASIGGSWMNIMGNLSGTTGAGGFPVATSGPNTGNTIALISLLNGAKLWDMPVLSTKVERGGGSSPWPYTIWSDGTGNEVRNCSGHITTSMQGVVMQAGGKGAVTNAEEFTFKGQFGDFSGNVSDCYPVPPAIGGNILSWTNSGNGATITNLPASGTLNWTNLGPDALVRVNGGTVTSISMNGVILPGVTTLTQTISAGVNLSVVFTAAPTVTVTPASFTQNT